MTIEVFELIGFGILGFFIFLVFVYLVYLICRKIRRRIDMKRRAKLREDLRKLRLLEWSDELSNNDSCSMCYETFPSGARICVFPCKHASHIICAEQWIRHGVLRCPMCHNEIIPNSLNYSEEDFLPLLSTSSQTRDEQISLLRPSFLKHINLRIEQYLRVPSEIEESISQRHIGRSITSSTMSKKPALLDSPKPKYVKLVIPNDSGEDSDDENEVTEKILRKFSLSPDSVFCTPKTRLCEENAPSSSRSTLYYSIPRQSSKEIKVDIHQVRKKENSREEST